MLLAGAIEACAAYQALRAGLAFRGARTAAALDAANVRALSAIGLAALGAGELLRTIGGVLLIVAVGLWAWHVAGRRLRIIPDP